MPQINVKFEKISSDCAEQQAVLQALAFDALGSLAAYICIKLKA